MPNLADFSRPVFAKLMQLTASLHPIGLSILAAAAQSLTPGVSRHQVRRAIALLLERGTLEQHKLVPGRWTRTVRAVITPGFLWGLDSRFRTYDVERGPPYARMPHDAVNSHLVIAHRIAAALVSDEAILADMQWLEAARMSAPRIARVDRLSIQEGLVHTGYLPVGQRTLLGIVSGEERVLLFGGIWTPYLGAQRLERLTKAVRPVQLHHSGGQATAWVQSAARLMTARHQYEKESRAVRLVGARAGAREAFYRQMLAICESRTPTNGEIFTRSIQTLLEWRRESDKIY